MNYRLITYQKVKKSGLIILVKHHSSILVTIISDVEASKEIRKSQQWEKYHKNQFYLDVALYENGVCKYEEFISGPDYSIVGDTNISTDNKVLFNIYPTPDLKLAKRVKFDIITLIKNEIKCPYFFISSLSMDEYLFLNDHYKDNKTPYRSFCLKNNQLIWQKEASYIFNNVDNYLIVHLFENGIFANHDKPYAFSRMDAATGELIWTVDVRGYATGTYTIFPGTKPMKLVGQAITYIGVYNNIFWVDLNQGTTLGIDIETGEIIHTLRVPDEELTDSALNEGYYKPNLCETKLDVNNKMLLGIYHNRVWEIDLSGDKPYYKFWTLKELTDNQYILANPERWVFDDEYIYFVKIMSRDIIVLDRKTKTVKHVIHVPAEDMGTIQNLIVEGDYLYFKDHLNSLFIMKRES